MTRHAAPPDAHQAAEEPARPARPGAIELAAAILVVGGAIGLIAAVMIALSPSAAADPFLGLTFALDAAAVAVGVLVRTGRLWIVAVNYAAVLGFLDLLAADTSPLALMLGLADIVVVVILFVHKPWFDALARWRRERSERGRAGRLSP